jgi:hypothetical protein
MKRDGMLNSFVFTRLTVRAPVMQRNIQACFKSVVWNVAEEFGCEDDVARYMCERDLRLTLLDSFQAVFQRLEDKKT